MQGWDKTYCLQFLTNEFDTIHFFGDKTFEVSALPLCPLRCSIVCQHCIVGTAAGGMHAGLQGGNDYEIFSSDQTIGHTVASPAETVRQCTELFISSA